MKRTGADASPSYSTLGVSGADGKAAGKPPLSYTYNNHYIKNSIMTSVHDLKIGTLLEDDHETELRVTEIEGDHDSVTWEVLDENGEVEYTETWTGEEIQPGFDHNELTILRHPSEPPDADTSESGEDTDSYPQPEINGDLDASEIPEDDLYIRFGALPPDERSFDHANGNREDGVSVYPVRRVPAPDDADYSNFNQRPSVMYEPYGNKIQQILFLMFRDTYLVTGERVGTGTDGEPLLRNVEVIGQLGSPAGVEGWVLGKYEHGPYDPTDEFK